MTEPKVVVVGAGLAGMAAALRLAEMGCRVKLFEEDARIGGQAGSALRADRYEDHGFHVAFPWYVNFLRVAEEVGAASHWEPCNSYHQLRVGEYPHFHTLRSVLSLGTFYADLTNGLISVPDRILYYYTLLDLLSRRYSGPQARSDESVDAFLGSRWYTTPGSRREIDRLLLTAHATPTTQSSARTWRAAISAFARAGQPLCYMPRLSLEESLIAPYRRHLESLGVELLTGWRLVRADATGNEIERLLFDTPGGRREIVCHQVVMAIPHHAVAALEGNAIERAGLITTGFRSLISRPLASLHLHLSRRLDALPREHVSLVGSSLAISLVDVAHTRPGRGGSELNIILGAPGDLLTSSTDTVVKEVVKESRCYIPDLSLDDVADAFYQPHVKEPLYCNDVGSWDNRPAATTCLNNLFLAGDYCRSHVDVAGMEGATVTGLCAADAVRHRLSLPSRPVAIAVPEPVSLSAVTAARIVLSPLAAATRVLSSRYLSPRPAGSSPSSL